MRTHKYANLDNFKLTSQEKMMTEVTYHPAEDSEGAMEITLDQMLAIVWRTTCFYRNLEKWPQGTGYTELGEIVDDLINEVKRTPQAQDSWRELVFICERIFKRPNTSRLAHNQLSFCIGRERIEAFWAFKRTDTGSKAATVTLKYDLATRKTTATWFASTDEPDELIELAIIGRETVSA
jgi:hypothetical protein